MSSRRFIKVNAVAYTSGVPECINSPGGESKEVCLDSQYNNINDE